MLPPDLSRLAKILTFAGHPNTSDTEAQNALDNLCRLAGVEGSGAADALRAVYALLDRAGLSFSNLVEPKVVRIEVPVYPTPSSLVRRTEEAEREAKDLRKKLNAAEAKTESLKKRLAETKDELREVVRANREMAKKAQPQPQPEEPTPNLDSLVAALQVLRKIDPDMRIKTAIALILTHSAGQKGTTVKSLVEKIADASDGSIRYAMRSLGQGSPGKRTGYGLVQECNSPDGGRARLFVTSVKGHAVMSDVIVALGARSTQPVLMNVDVRLAA